MFHQKTNFFVEWELSGLRSVCDVSDVREDRWDPVLSKRFWFYRDLSILLAIDCLCLLHSTIMEVVSLYTKASHFFWGSYGLCVVILYDRIGCYLWFFWDSRNYSTLHLYLCLCSSQIPFFDGLSQNWIFRYLLESSTCRRAFISLRFSWVFYYGCVCFINSVVVK